MREILFRGKRESNGEWIYGNYCGAEYLTNEGIEHFIIEVPRSGSSARVIPETVGQYTGLTDKNGNKIFEGDIIRDLEDYFIHKKLFEKGIKGEKKYEEYLTNARVGVVKFLTEDVASCGCCYTRFLGTGFIAERIDMSCCEVIGNIHDNPELLKGGVKE